MRKKPVIYYLLGLLLPIVSVSSTFATPAEDFKQADALYNMAKYDRVEQICIDLLKADPNDPNLAYEVYRRMCIAITNVHLGNDEAVDAIMQDIVNRRGSDERVVKCITQIAWAYRRLERYDEAQTVYRYVVKTWPDKDQTIFAQRGIILCCIELGDEACAQAALQKLITDFADSLYLAESLEYIASRYQRKGKFAKARRMHKDVVEEFADSNNTRINVIKAQRNMILCSVSLGDDKMVEADVQTLLTQFSQNKDFVPALYYVTDRLDPAARRAGEPSSKDTQRLGLYQYIVDKHPNHELTPCARAKVGQLKLFQGDKKAAEGILQGVLAIPSSHPNYARTLNFVAESYYKRALATQKQKQSDYANHYRKAIAVWEQIAKELPQEYSAAPQAYYFAAACYRRLGQYEKAIEYFQNVLNNWPEYEYAWRAQSLTGDCYEKLKKSGRLAASQADPKIEQAYKAVIENHPDRSVAGNAYLKLARMASEKGQLDKVAGYYEDFLNNYPKNKRYTNILFRFGRIYEKMDKLEQAAQIYQLLVKQGNPDKPLVKGAMLKLARLASRKSQWAEAAGYYEVLLNNLTDERRYIDILYSLGHAYEQMGKVEQAAQIYQLLIQQGNPEDRFVKTSMRRLAIMKGEEK